MSIRILGAGFFTALAITLGLSRAASAATVNVTTAAELRVAFAAATAGTTIHLAPGAYAIDMPLTTAAAGVVGQPITLTSDKAIGARLDFSSTDGLVIAHAYWVIDGVSLNGTCSGCSATGLRVGPGANNLIVHSSRFTNFATAIKGERAGDAEPADATIDTNEFFNGAQLPGGGTPIEIVGGKRWHLIGNYIHDYTGTGKHAAISLTGGASDAVVERNLVVGSKDAPAAGTSLAFSLGAGDTMPSLCAVANRGAASCTCELVMGRVLNNIVVRTTGHGVLLSRACGTQVILNTVYLTVPGLEITLPGPTGTLDVRYNVMSGSMGGIMAASNKENVAAVDFKNCYKDPDNLDFTTGPNDKLINDLIGVAAIAPPINVTTDYLGDPRNSTLDYGAIELKLGTRATWPWPGTALIGTGMGPPGGGVVGPGDGGAGTEGGGIAPPTDGGSGAPWADGGDGGSIGTPLPEGGGPAGGGTPPADGGSGAGSSPSGDGGAGGQAATPGSGGCSCEVALGSSGSLGGAAPLLLALLGLLAGRSIRRRVPART
jgi:hypothetical protein